jgi:catalase
LISLNLDKLLTAEQKQLLFGNTICAIAGATEQVKIRHIGNCFKADTAYEKGVAEVIGIPPSNISK